MLQMVFQVVHDTVSYDGLVPTLHVFGAYFCIVIDLLLFLLQQQQAHALAKARASSAN